MCVGQSCLPEQMWTKNARQAAVELMEGPEPRREKSCSFSQTPCRGGKKILTTKEALCLRLFQLKGLARTHPPRWKEKEKKEFYVVKNFHESGWGENVCNLFVLH